MLLKISRLNKQSLCLPLVLWFCLCFAFWHQAPLLVPLACLFALPQLQALVIAFLWSLLLSQALVLCVPLAPFYMLALVLVVLSLLALLESPYLLALLLFFCMPALFACFFSLSFLVPLVPLVLVCVGLSQFAYMIL